MEQETSIREFFEDCNGIAALWRFDGIASTADEVLFDKEDEDNFVSSFMWFYDQQQKGILSKDHDTELTGAFLRVKKALLEALKVHKLGTRIRMIRLLSRLRIPEALHPLLLILRSSESIHERDEAAEALGHLGLPEACTDLNNLLCDEHQPTSLRAKVAKALGTICPTPFIEDLVSVFRSSDRFLCDSVADALTKADMEQLVPILVQKWNNVDWSPTGRLKTAFLLVRYGKHVSNPIDIKQYKQTIIDAINDDVTAHGAISITTELGIACEKELLTAVRTLSDTDNRAYALEALSKSICTPKAISSGFNASQSQKRYSSKISP